MTAEGRTQEAIAQVVGVTRVTVDHWCRRFAKQRLAGLGRWSCRSMARAAGISDVEFRVQCEG